MIKSKYKIQQRKANIILVNINILINPNTIPKSWLQESTKQKITKWTSPAYKQA